MEDFSIPFHVFFLSDIDFNHVDVHKRSINSLASVCFISFFPNFTEILNLNIRAMDCSTFWKYLLFLPDFLFVVMTTDSVSVDDIVAKAIDNGYRNVRFEEPCYDTDDQSK